MGRSLLFFALMILGVVALLAGPFIGLSSRQALYKSAGQSTIAHYLSKDGYGYLQVLYSPKLFIVSEADFTPALHGTQTLKNGYTVAVVYDANDVVDIDVASNMSHLVGKAYRVVKIMHFAPDGQIAYSTAAYREHPQGYNQNNWGLGIGLMVVGLVMVGGAFFLPQRKGAGRNERGAALATPTIPGATTREDEDKGLVGQAD